MFNNKLDPKPMLECLHSCGKPTHSLELNAFESFWFTEATTSMSASILHEKAPEQILSTTTSDTAHDAWEDATIGFVSDVNAGSQALHRKLRGRQVQLFAIGGATVTCTSRAIFRTQAFQNARLMDFQLSTCRWALLFLKEALPVCLLSFYYGALSCGQSTSASPRWWPTFHHNNSLTHTINDGLRPYVIAMSG